MTMHATRLTPKLKAAVQAAYSSPGHKLVRCPDGYAPPGRADQTVTRRVVNMLERDYVLRYQGDMHAEAVLTSKGERIAAELVNG